MSPHLWSAFWLLLPTSCCLGILGASKAPSLMEQREDKARLTEPCHLFTTWARLNYFCLSFLPVEWGRSWLSWGHVKLIKMASSSMVGMWQWWSCVRVIFLSPPRALCPCPYQHSFAWGNYLFIHLSLITDWSSRRSKWCFMHFCISSTQHSSRRITGTQSMFVEGWWWW